MVQTIHAFMFKWTTAIKYVFVVIKPTKKAVCLYLSCIFLYSQSILCIPQRHLLYSTAYTDT